MIFSKNCQTVVDDYGRWDLLDFTGIVVAQQKINFCAGVQPGPVFREVNISLTLGFKVLLDRTLLFMIGRCSL